MHCCFACTDVCVRVLDSLELEFEVVVNWELHRGPLEEGPVLLPAEPSLWPHGEPGRESGRLAALLLLCQLNPYFLLV